MQPSEAAGAVALVLGVVSLLLVGVCLVPAMLPTSIVGDSWRHRARLGLAAGSGASIILLATAAAILPPVDAGTDTAPTTTSTSQPARSPSPTTTPPPAPSPTSAPATSAPTSVASPGVPGARTVATVVAVIDGDTLDVLVEGRSERVRLVGIDAPERGECWADDATAALTTLVAEGTISMTRDQSDRDQFGRLLRYVWTAEGTFVNEELVASGSAIARRYPPDVAEADRLAAAAESARDDGKGLWSTTACGPAGETTIGFTAAVFDPSGDDLHPVTGERVTITNRGSTPVDLTGWMLADEGPHRFSFPSGFTLGVGESVTVYTACGDDVPGFIYWCNRRSAVWNNTGDTAFLWDPSGNVVDSTGPIGSPPSNPHG